jgi:small-conductance mechanosensitive channel
MNVNFTVIHNLILTPVLYLFIIIIFYGLTKRNFKSLNLGALFFLFAISVLCYFYLSQVPNLNFFNIPLNIYTVIQKLFIFIIILSASLIILKILDELIFNTYLFKKANIHVPTLFRDIIMFTILGIIIITALKIEFGLKLTGILTSSAIVSVIIGFALQDTLANIIAGVVMHIEKPFDLNDWVKIGDKEGEVVETSWKATRLKTLEGNYIIIPNTIISKEIIVNYYKPTKAHALSFNIGLDYDVPPSKVKETALKTIDDCSNVLKIPAPAVIVTEFGNSAIQYTIKIWIDNHSIHKIIQDEIMTKLWYSMKRNDIQIPFPIQTVYLHQGQDRKENINKENLEIKINSIKNTEIFKDFNHSDIDTLAKLTKIKSFTKGEKIIIQDEESYSLYIITKGNVNIYGKNANGSPIPLKELKEGEYFGEMSLLTGEKRSATAIAQNETEVLEIGPSDILPLLLKNPKLMELLSGKLAERKLETKGIIDSITQAEQALGREVLSKNILTKIKHFFHKHTI